LNELTQRMAGESTEPDNRVSGGPLVSREQYLYDLDELGYEDGRVEPYGLMKPEEIDIWTAAINDTDSH
jgi:hypothetical protein